ncbi:MAG: hypothetical protein LBT92_00885 [Rickettsiales bacterium]|jgi:hypothetical protein|nr:hypothetical protein [Rickettsiales bacterium]
MKKENKDGDSVLDLALATDGDSAGSCGPDIKDGMAEACEAIAGRLRASGMTPGQIKLVCDLAAEVLEPAIESVAEHYRALRELEKLEEYFGGEERFDEISRQIISWGRKSLPSDVFETLGTTCQGVIALYGMMQSSEPVVANVAGAKPGAMTEAKLRDMMRDPRYWRDNDAEFVKSVGDGFRKLYDRRA